MANIPELIHIHSMEISFKRVSVRSQVDKNFLDSVTFDLFGDKRNSQSANVKF